MDIAILAAWGEFIGGIAVVASLLYLASQIRQNSRLLRISTAAAMGDADIAFNTAMMGDAELARIFTEGMRDPASLSAAEKLRFGVMVDLGMRAFHRSYVFARGAGVDHSLWQTEVRSYAPVIQSIGGQEWWNDARAMFSDDFGVFVDGLIREAEADG